MARLASAPPMESVSWVEVTASAACPVCGARTGCEVALRDPVYARCRVVRSALPVHGGGWLHVCAPGPRSDEHITSAA